MTKHSSQPSTKLVPDSILERAKDAQLRPEDLIEMPTGLSRQERKAWFLAQIGSDHKTK